MHCSVNCYHSACMQNLTKDAKACTFVTAGRAVDCAAAAEHHITVVVFKAGLKHAKLTEDDQGARTALHTISDGCQVISLNKVSPTQIALHDSPHSCTANRPAFSVLLWLSTMKIAHSTTIGQFAFCTCAYCHTNAQCHCSKLNSAVVLQYCATLHDAFAPMP